PWPYYPLTNLQGLDIEHAAVQISRVTLWMGHRQMIDRYGESEPPLPLQDLSSIRRADALRTRWPETDCIIGNPPFLGSQWIRRSFGDDYVEWLKRAFGVGIKDFCTYWFRLATDHLQPGQRAGLVGTNSVSQNRARSASLDYVVAEDGVITDGIKSQKWPGEAHVHVSIVNWVRDPATPPQEFTLEGVAVSGIRADLTETSGDNWVPQRLAANAGRCFQGPIPVRAGFIVSEEEARVMLADDTTDYSAVVRPYVTGDDIANRPDQSPGRWIIDFAQRRLEEAQHFPAALAIVRARVKPERDQNRREARRRRWWLFGEQAIGMRRAIAGQGRWLGSLAFGKRLFLAWEDAWTCPAGKIYIFSFDDDYSMGILQSKAHNVWAWHQGGTLETRLSYTPTSVFETFPFPDPVTEEQQERVAETSRRLLATRSQICSTEQIGLTKLYNAVDEGAWTDLVALHRELDEAVAECYDWPRAVAQDPKELVRRLTALNREISEGQRPYAPFDWSRNLPPIGRTSARGRHRR
ncbi:MAG: DNA methyltransferase, partial [Nocardioides sp.]